MQRAVHPLPFRYRAQYVFHIPTLSLMREAITIILPNDTRCCCIENGGGDKTNKVTRHLFALSLHRFVAPTPLSPRGVVRFIYNNEALKCR